MELLGYLSQCFVWCKRSGLSFFKFPIKEIEFHRVPTGLQSGIVLKVIRYHFTFFFFFFFSCYTTYVIYDEPTVNVILESEVVIS